MKKVAGLMLIVLSLIQLIGNLISIPDQLEYMSGFHLIFPLMVWPLTNVAFMLLGLSLFAEKNTANATSEISTSYKVEVTSNDIPSTGLNIVSFLIPIVGLIIYLTEKDRSPRKANSAGVAALWGVGISVVLTIISIVISATIISSAY